MTRHAFSLRRTCILCAGLSTLLSLSAPRLAVAAGSPSPRERILFNSDWRFTKGDPDNAGTNLDYPALKPWLVATGPEFSVNSTPPTRPEGNPGSDVVYTQPAC